MKGEKTKIMMKKTTKRKMVVCLVLVMSIFMTRNCLYQSITAKGAEYNKEGRLICGEKNIDLSNTNLNPFITNNPLTCLLIVDEETEKIELIRAIAPSRIQTVNIKSVKPRRPTLKEVKKEMNLNMDLAKPSGLSKKDFSTLLSELPYDYTGFFKEHAEYIWDLSYKYGVNEIFLTAIIANESKWASYSSAIECNNYTGQKVGGRLLKYPSARACLEKTAKNLGKKYLKNSGEYYHGKTLYAVNEEYCEPGKHDDGTSYKYMWADNVYKCMEMIVDK